jgi:putative acetyltransferase
MNQSAYSFELVSAASHPLLPALRELLLEYQRFLGVDLCFQSFEQELSQLPGEYAPPLGRAYVVTDTQGNAVGCMALRKIDAPGYANPFEIKRVYLRASHQGQGLGRRMTQRIVDDARNLGASHLLLDTLPQLKTSHALYESMGWKDIAAYNDNPVASVRFMALDLLSNI